MSETKRLKIISADERMAQEGDIPTIKLGPKLMRVPVRALELMLDKAGESQAAAGREDEAS